MFDFIGNPAFFNKNPYGVATNLPAAQAVMTDRPSVSMMHSQVGTRLLSISPEQ